MDKKRMAGPVLRGGESTAALVEAIIADNPEKHVSVRDHGAYVRVEAEDGMIIRKETVEQMLGRPFLMQEIEIAMTGFAGKIETTEHYVRWYFNSAPATSTL